MNGRYEHIPVLSDRIVELLVSNPNGCYVDGTLGGAGHARAILERLASGGSLVGFDKDEQALEASLHALSKSVDRVSFVHGDFMQMTTGLLNLNIDAVDGILLDLGVSSHQIDTAERGFSYMHDGPLDMRMDSSNSITAHAIVNEASAPELERIFQQYGEERLARSIANGIVKARNDGPIDSTLQLVGIIKLSVRRGPLYKSCARIFQAIRIAVNKELDSLSQAVSDAVDLLRTGGRMVVLTYHSLEDRAVKHTFRDLARSCICPPGIPQCICEHEAKVRVITKRPLYPSSEEISANPRARSAKLRCVERLLVSSQAGPKSN
ncbi:MAG: 16S rRNA (cytosine(1402)-N(4))-methyltransferase RsmH [Candidatus Latescibacteria bacterium]|nr:16S rRNA (cytosine(1402)-N(4))-methyltransferase RsmH [Candidatus Latescibacterota bacterium]